MPDAIQKDHNAPEGLQPTPPEEQAFSLEEAMKAQSALRSAARMPPERFPLQQIIGMMSDEIQKLREAGRPDEEIAAIISGNSMIKVDADTIARFYATPEDRHKGPPESRL